MDNDFRNTKYCCELCDLDIKKQNLADEILKEHPRNKIMYNQIKNNKAKYRKKFIEIYNYKCSYCGSSIENINIQLLEIDHYICESKFDSKIEAGKIENLVLSCKECNRNKGALLIDDVHKEILNPDLVEIRNVFKRNDDYYIKIADKYQSDKFIENFYSKLKLGNESKRLDFLLLNIQGLLKSEILKDNIFKSSLNEILNILKTKRNLI